MTDDFDVEAWLEEKEPILLKRRTLNYLRTIAAIKKRSRDEILQKLLKEYWNQMEIQ